MKYKLYSSTFWDRVHKTLEVICQQDPSPVAAFDADGTLWDTDLGENFFQYQIDQQKVPLPENPWEYYVQLKKKNNDPREAYLWLAQICKGLPLATVRSWATEAYRQLHPVPIFDEQLKLIQLFHQHKVQVYIVTASVSWAVEPGAHSLGVPASHVVGIETQVKNEVITDLGVFPITYKEGKREALLKHTSGKRPFFASGNTLGDLSLLESATEMALAVSAASRDDRLFKAERELFEEAEKRSWITHRFI